MSTKDECLTFYVYPDVDNSEKLKWRTKKTSNEDYYQIQLHTPCKNYVSYIIKARLAQACEASARTSLRSKRPRSVLRSAAYVVS